MPDRWSEEELSGARARQRFAGRTAVCGPKSPRVCWLPSLMLICINDDARWRS